MMPAIGGVIIPIPRLQPMIAANWIGWTPSSSTPGKSSGVTSKVPPSRLSESPSDETVTSIRLPWRENGGSVPVTITAATFWVFNSSSRMLMPNRSSMPIRLCSVNGEPFRLSPVPSNPTTRP